MFEIASQIIICLILAALLGWIIGYLMGRATCYKDEECQTQQDNTHELHVDNINKPTMEAKILSLDSTTETVSTEPILLTEAREGGKDNLQLIKGVGKVLEETLNKIGVYHFDQISNWNDDEANWIDATLSFPGRIARDNWREQAEALAKGKETEFSKRVERGEVSSSKKS